MKVALISDQLNVLGGIRTTLISLCHTLKRLGLEIQLGQTLEDVHNPDIIWAHSPSSLNLIRQLSRWHEQHPKQPFYYQVHDYREVCLTGRKACGKELGSCWREFGMECFAIHYFQGCGTEYDPRKLMARYKLVKAQLELMKSATKVIVFSDYVRDQITMNGISSEKIIKMLPAFEQPTARENRRKARQDQNSMLWYGRFSHEKGPLEFIHLLQHLKEAKIKIDKAYMIGEGPMQNSLHLLAHEFELDDTLSFINWASPEDLWNYVSESTFVHFTSIWPEPFGLLGIETMALGIPVLGRPVGGANEWLRNDFGHMAINSENSQHMLDAAIHLFTDRHDLKLRSDKLKQSFQNNFAEHRQIESISSILKV